MGKEKEEFDQFKYQNDYIREHYVRKSVTIPKHMVKDIEEFIKSKGYKKFGPYVIDLIKRDMEGNIASKNINIGEIEHKGKGDININ